MKQLAQDVISVKRQKLHKLPIPTLEGYELLDAIDILYLKANVNYTTLYLNDKTKITSSKNLGFYEDELAEEPFLRIHNSTIVNLTKVKSYIRGDDGWVIMQDGETLKVSKTKKDELLIFFQSRKQNNNSIKDSIAEK
ncbi:MAG: LytTR family transcriptional regulator [Bacteroidetes bacterium]|nr:LytTR family transcriptional regulator [Bacteroidota bacterium]